jgi:hypothetical protein
MHKFLKRTAGVSDGLPEFQQLKEFQMERIRAPAVLELHTRVVILVQDHFLINDVDVGADEFRRRRI